MNSAIEVLFLRRPRIDYISPPICEAIFSSSSGPVIVLNPLTPQGFPTGLIFSGGSGNFFLSWDNYPGALCYSVYKADTADPFGSYTIIAECIPNSPFNIVPFGSGCYRISAITANGETPLSLPACFDIPQGGNPPSVTTQPADNILAASARLNGTVSPNGLPTTVHFEWGFTTAYGNVTGNQNVGLVSGPFNAAIGGLNANTTYHFRAVGTNSAGTAFGADASFVTLNTSPGTPLAWWKFEESGEDTRVDATGHGFDLSAQSTDATTGIIGNGIHFLPANPFYDAVVEGSASQQTTSDFSFSAAFWVKWNTWDSATLFTLGNFSLSFSGAAGLGISITWKNGVLAASMSDLFGTPFITASTAFTPTAGQLYFFHVYYDPATGRINLKRDDTTLNTSAGTFSPVGYVPANISALFEVTNGDSPGDPITADMVLDEYGIWSPRISDASATFLYNGGAGKTYPF